MDPQIDNKNIRIASIDVLRGFTMFWIIGGTGLLAAVIKFFVPKENEILSQLNHSSWEGFTFYDFIFPLFIFVIGMSIVLSLDKIITETGKK